MTILQSRSVWGPLKLSLSPELHDYLQSGKQSAPGVTDHLIVTFDRTHAKGVSPDTHYSY